MKKAFGISAILLLWATFVFGQLKLTAKASKATVAINEPFEVDFAINANGGNFTAPHFSDFRVLFGPNLLTNESIVNGDTAFNNTYKYIIIAKKEGSYNIGTASIVVDGHTTLLSNLLKIKVKGQISQSQQDQLLVQQESNMLQPAFDTVDIKNLSKQIFIKVEADKTHAYVGKPIKVTYELYSCVDIDSSMINKAPDFSDFRVQGVPDSGPRKIGSTPEYVNGKKYNVSILAQCMVFPKHAGDLTITPLIMAAVLPLQSPRKMAADSSSGDAMQFNYEFKSDSVIIHVRGSSKSRKHTGS